jgi:hypothetical protein
MPAPPYCGFCGKGPFPTVPGLHIHIQNSVTCRQKARKEFGDYSISVWDVVEENVETSQEANSRARDDTSDLEAEYPDPEHLLVDFDPFPPHSPAAEPEDDNPPPVSDPNTRRVTVEEVEDEDDEPSSSARHIRGFPAEMLAGAALRRETPMFEKIREDTQDHTWGPFEGQEEWELAEWLVRNVGQTQTEAFLKLPIVRHAHKLEEGKLPNQFGRRRTAHSLLTTITATSSIRLMPYQHKALNGRVI